MVRVAVLVSGGGTNLQALLDAQDRGELGAAEITYVISNRKAAYALERAKNHNVETGVLSKVPQNHIKVFDLKDNVTDYAIKHKSRMTMAPVKSVSAEGYENIPCFYRSKRDFVMTKSFFRCYGKQNVMCFYFRLFKIHFIQFIYRVKTSVLFHLIKCPRR